MSAIGPLSEAAARGLGRWRMLAFMSLGGMGFALATASFFEPEERKLFASRFPQRLRGIGFVSSKVLITGGAGFIGTHVARELLVAGYSVRVFDNLDPQVHDRGRPPVYLDHDAEMMIGDVTDRDTLRRALTGVDLVCHLAAAVGVGQSIYEIEHYTRINDVGTAVLLEALIDSNVQRVVVASSMSIYGEGLARAGERFIEPAPRTIDQLQNAEWELRSSEGDVLQPVPTPETKAHSLHSIYALNKYTQEQMAMIFGVAHRREVVALRLFNVYGPYQALSNPYSGMLASFGSRLLDNQQPLLFEDGYQRRDFVHVRDVARACRAALESPEAVGRAINVGSGENRSALDAASTMAKVMGRDNIEPMITGKYRAGDIRHCFANISLAREVLRYTPRVEFETGLAELVEWLLEYGAEDRTEAATQELSRRGLVAWSASA